MNDPAIAAALDVARGLAAGGIPLFLARPAGPEDAEHWRKVGFVLPKEWNTTRPDPAVVDRWQPGMALCAVMGHGLDLLDIDPRSGGQLPPELVNDVSPYVHAGATTPSGGFHLFITSLGVGSRDGVFPGVDIKGGGDPNKPGGGHGFAFLAPTVKISKATGQMGAYAWTQPPGYRQVPPGHATGLAAAVLAVKGVSASAQKPRATSTEVDPLAHYVNQKEPHSTLVADRVIAAKLDELRAQPAQTGAGFRTALLAAAMTLGGYVGAGHLAESVAYEYLLDAVSDVWGHANTDDELWITQGLTDGAQRPFSVYAPHEAISGNLPLSDEAERKWQFYDVIGVDPFDPHVDSSDQGLADQVLARVYPGLRAGVDTGSWVVRGPEVWEEAEDMAAWAISAVARLMPLGRKAESGEDKGPEHWQHERRKLFMSSAGASRVAKKMKDITRGADHFATVRVSALDTDAEVAWGGGVPWDLRASGDQPVVAAVDPGVPHLHTMSVAPALVPTPAWDAYLAAIWPDPEVRGWALRVVSISLAGYPDAALPVLYGPERTGKSSFVSLLIKLLGTYAHAADPRILAGAENAHASVIYALKGRRLSFIDEGPRKGHLATERLKQVTGGAELTGNAMRANPITFAPTHTLIMSTNDEPQISDAALRARMRIIPCEANQDAVRLAREAITPAVWKAEAPGVLAALMRETAEWLAHRATALNEAAPLTVRNQNEELARTQDVFAQWVDERTVPDETGTKGRDLHHAFAVWHGDHPALKKTALPTETAFGRALTRLGYPVMPRVDGKYRALKLSTGNGEWGPFITAPQQSVVTVSVPPTTLSGSVAGSAELAEQPVNPENPSSNPVTTSVVDGLTSYTTNTSHKTHTPLDNKNTGEIGNYPTTRKAVSGPLPPPHSALPMSAPDQGQCPVCYAPIGITKAGKLRAHKDGTDKCAGAGLKVPGFVTESQKAKAAERAARIEELAGPVLGLPAAMRRGEEPRSVDLAEAAAVIKAALERNAGMLAVDIESNALPPWHPEAAVRTIQLGDWAEGIDLDATDPEHLAFAAAALAQATEIDAYSYTADLAPLAKLGVIDYAAALAKAVDVAVIAKLADPAHTGNGDGLKEIGATVLGDAATAPAAEDAKDAYFAAAGWISQLKPDTADDKNGWRYADHSRATMIRYGISDVLDCSALRLKLPQPDPALLARERRIQSVVAPLPLHGVKLAGETVSEQLRDREPRAAEKLAGIQALGVENPDSSKQLTERFTQLGVHLPRTKPSKTAPEGNLTAKADVLEKIQHYPGDAGALAKLVLDYRADATLLKNMIRPWARSTQHGDSRTYPTIYTLGADTGRMSCVRPNLQQVSREGGLRECLIADDDYLFIAADFSSVEVRVAAYVSGDQNLINMILGALTCHVCLDGVTCPEHDLHAKVAKMAYGPGFTKAQRYNVKRVVFGRLYGGGEDTLAAQSGLTIAMVRTIIQMLDAIAPRLRAWSEEIKQAVKAGMTQFLTYSGRVIHLDRRFPHKAPNYIIQGTARELLGDALIKWDDGPYRGGIVLPVHDEIVAMVPAVVAHEATRFLVSCMTSQLGPVPITVEADEPSREWQSAA